VFVELTICIRILQVQKDDDGGDDENVNIYRDKPVGDWFAR